MSITVVLLFQGSMIFSEFCTGLQFHSETDGGVNLECKVVQTQAHSNAPIPAGIEDIFINNVEYPDCTLFEESVQTDSLGQNNVSLYYLCPSLPDVPARLHK